LDHLDYIFWDYDKRSKKFGRIDKYNIKNILKRIYVFRSKLLHEGEQFPVYILDHPISFVNNELE